MSSYSYSFRYFKRNIWKGTIICIRLQNIDMIINYDVTKWPLHHGSKYVSSLMCVHAGYCLNATSGVPLLPSQWRVNVWSINIQGGNLPAFGISIFHKVLPWALPLSNNATIHRHSANTQLLLWDEWGKETTLSPQRNGFININCLHNYLYNLTRYS